MSEQTNSTNTLSIDFGNELSRDLTIHKNVNQEIIVTTSDKIKLVLINTRETLTAQRDWWTPAGLLLSFITTLCTADFKDSLGLKKEVWHALFVLITVASSIWLVRCFWRLWKNRNKVNLDKIIEQIKLRTE